MDDDQHGEPPPGDPRPARLALFMLLVGMPAAIVVGLVVWGVLSRA